MNSIERVIATIERKPVDRPAAWLGMPDHLAIPGLCEEFGVKDFHELRAACGDDFYALDLPYKSPEAHAIYAAFDWYKNGSDVDAEHRTLTADGCFKDAEELEDLDFFEWPDPEKYIDPEECKKVMAEVPEGKAAMVMAWSAHFQDTCAAFGMQTCLVNMIANPEIVHAVNDKIVDFYLKANEIFYKAAGDRLNCVLIGNDLGSQRGLMVGPKQIEEFVIPGCKKLVDQAHAYGLKVIYHSCGSIIDAIPLLIEAGVDVIHPIQALAADMDPATLKSKFDGSVSFCGGVDTQDLLVNGTEDMVRDKVKELRKYFPTGLVISPSHEAIMNDIPPKNIKALFDEAQKIY
ncbi:MAG: uroporphyrinogen decarboxylase family protein [Lachnospiraceae bacterium]